MVRHQLVLVRVDTPVPERVAGVGADLILGPGPEPPERPAVVGQVLLVLPTMHELAGRGEVVALLHKAFGQQRTPLCRRRLGEVGVKEVDARRLGVQRAHHARARGVAHRRLAVRVGEQHASLG